MMPQPVRRAFTVAVVLACTGAFACSFSHSSAGSSDSSKSSSDSSRSSSGGKDTALFQRDVEYYTEAFVESGGAREQGFFEGLGDLARRRGVSDWESEPGTWEAVGRGLARSRVDDAQRNAYQTAWADGDSARQGALAQGFATAR